MSDESPSRSGEQSPAIVFWPWTTGHAATRTLSAALEGAHETASFVLPDAPDGRALLARLTDGERERVSLLATTEPAGLSQLIVAAAAQHPGADVAVIANACELGGGWLEQLEASLNAEDTLAISSVFPSNPAGADPLDPSQSATDEENEFRLGEAVAAPAPLTPDPAACLIRRRVLELVGPPDPRFRHPFAVLADLAARARERGLHSTIAAEVSAARIEGGLAACPVSELASLREAHPWFEEAVRDERALDAGPTRRRLISSRTSRSGMSVTVDARSLGAGVGGTQTYVASLLTGLAQVAELSVRAVVAGELDPELLAVLEQSGVVLVDYEDAASGRLRRTDIVHRPQQVFSPSDLRLLDLLGERLVISHLDLIAYRAANYHDSVDTWRSYKRTTRIALATADHVLFFSEHAREDAVAEDLVPKDRTSVAGIGVSPTLEGSSTSRPATVREDTPFLLMLGADYLHKNRPFAIRLVDALRRHHGWDGKLVFAGSHVLHGSSAVAEAEALSAAPELGEMVIDLGQVTEGEKRWLMEAATAHLAPSTYEGFGLAPLEAASVGKPCMFAACTSFAEIIDPAAATIVPWDPVKSADTARGLLVPGPARERHLQLLGDALGRNSWDRLIPLVTTAYGAAIASPYRGAHARGREELEREQLLASLHEHARGVDERSRELEAHAKAVDARCRELEAHANAVDERYDDLLARVDTGLRLVDARGGLLSEREQHGLMRIAGHRWLRRPLFAALAAAGPTAAQDADRQSSDLQADDGDA